ncbi:MAG: proline dehydrogenase family protein [Chthonomonadales bacterium]
MLARAILLRLAESPNLKRIAGRNGLAARLAHRFVAGESLEDTLEPVRSLNATGITASLDYLGENVHDREEAGKYAEAYMRVVAFIRQNGLQANISIKLTQLGLDLGHTVALENAERIVLYAAEHDCFVRIDMEGSRYTEDTLNIFYALWSRTRNVGPVIQSYLYRSEGDVEKLIAAGARVRLVKGAYSEPAQVAYQRKSEVDSQYAHLMKELLRRGTYPAVATHDERLIRMAQTYARENAIAPNRYEFQMLYGIRRERQASLVREGYGVRVYVPFGHEWYGYMMRRLAERPANLWFVLRHLLRR